MNIFGITGNLDGFPTCELLHRGYDNSIHENTIEIARRYYQQAGCRHKAIMVIYEGSEHSVVYSKEDFRIK